MPEPRPRRPRAAVRWSVLRVPGAFVVTLALGVSAPSLASATCAPETGYSPCLDANALWPSPGAQRFFAIASPFATQPGKLSFGVQAQALVRPLVLEVPGPTHGAREVRLVDHTIDQTWLFDLGLGPGLSLGAILTAVLHQRGAGVEGITSQRGAPLDATVSRDPRLRVTYALRAARGFAVQPRFELALPLGEEEAFAGSGALTVAPAVALEAELGHVRMGVDVGARLRPVVELGTGRWGSQLSTAAGVSIDLAGDGRLFLSGELFALVPLVDSTSERGDALGVDTTWLPAEWLLSVGVYPERGAPWQVVLGGGAGLATSSDTLGGERRWFYGPTSPLFRGVLAIRYAPDTR